MTRLITIARKIKKINKKLCKFAKVCENVCEDLKDLVYYWKLSHVEDAISFC